VQTSPFQLQLIRTNRHNVLTLSAQAEQNRREFVQGILTSFAVLTAASTPPSRAYDGSYPVDLNFDNNDASRDLESIRKERVSKKREMNIKSKEEAMSAQIVPESKTGLARSATWASALWFLTGSRSNPLVTPVANVLYNVETEQWLKDRNDGLFAPLPFVLLVIMGALFFFLGIFTDRTLLLLSDGNTIASFQLAGVALINGGALELARVANGGKDLNREDFDRETQLREEFTKFAEKRLIKGGNCHRREVTNAFRRYFAKYRDPESEEFPLADLEIERLTKEWNIMRGGQPISGAGFLSGVQINDEADIFINR